MRWQLPARYIASIGALISRWVRRNRRAAVTLLVTRTWTNNQWISPARSVSDRGGGAGSTMRARRHRGVSGGTAARGPCDGGQPEWRGRRGSYLQTEAVRLRTTTIVGLKVRLVVTAVLLGGEWSPLVDQLGYRPIRTRGHARNGRKAISRLSGCGR